MVRRRSASRWTLERLLSEAESLERAGALTEALDRLELAMQTAVRARARERVPLILRRVGHVQLLSGHADAAEEMYTVAMTVAELNTNRVALASALNALGRMYHAGGDYGAAKRCLRRALRLLPPTQELIQGLVHHNLGVVLNSEGDLDDARLEWLDALTRFTSLGHTAGIARVYNNLGINAADRGDWGEAALYLDCALGMAAGSDHLGLEASVRLNRAVLGIARGDLSGARAELESAEKLLERLGYPRELAAEALDRFRALTVWE